MIAQPSGSEDLDCEQEFEEMGSALSDLKDLGLVKLERMESASLSNLAEDLEKPIHVLHFIGHGSFDRNLEQGFLHFEKRDGEPDPVSGLDLARVLRPRQSPALVVLNACEGGRAARDDPFGGVAQALMKDGTLAVVAMRARVTDEAALAFSKAFYKALVRGVTVDQAVYEARHSLFAGRFGHWGNPVLYSRSLDGTIFDFLLASPLHAQAPCRRSRSSFARGFEHGRIFSIKE